MRFLFIFVFSSSSVVWNVSNGALNTCQLPLSAASSFSKVDSDLYGVYYVWLIIFSLLWTSALIGVYCKFLLSLEFSLRVCWFVIVFFFIHLDNSCGDWTENFQSSCVWIERTGATRSGIAQHQTPAAEEQTGDGSITAARETRRRSGTHTYTKTSRI